MDNKDQITIKELGLKGLLGLFEGQEKLIINELGDTWHPADGFVDESYFKDIKTIDDLLGLEYDFNGLVIFDGQVNNLKILFDNDSDQFTVTGDKRELEKLRQRLKRGD
jgi:hypothetical protein